MTCYLASVQRIAKRAQVWKIHLPHIPNVSNVPSVPSLRNSLLTDLYTESLKILFMSQMSQVSQLAPKSPPAFYGLRDAQPCSIISVQMEPLNTCLLLPASGEDVKRLSFCTRLIVCVPAEHVLKGRKCTKVNQACGRGSCTASQA